MNVNSSNGYSFSSDDDADLNGSDTDDAGSFFDEFVDEDDEGSYIEEEEESGDDVSVSGELNNHDVVDDENEEESFANEEESYVDEEGSFVDEEGSYVDEEGSFVDEEGSFVDEEGSFVDEEGSYVDEEGSYVEEEGSYVDEEEYDANDDDGSYIEEEIIDGGFTYDEFITTIPTTGNNNHLFQQNNNYHHESAQNLNSYRSPLRQRPSLPFRSVTPSEEPVRKNDGVVNDSNDEEEQHFAQLGGDSVDGSVAVDESAGYETTEGAYHAIADDNADSGQYHAIVDDTGDEHSVEFDISYSQSESGDNDIISDSDERHTVDTAITDMYQQQLIQKQLQYHELKNQSEEQGLGTTSHHDDDEFPKRDIDSGYDDYDDGQKSYESGMSAQKSYDSGSQYDENDLDHETHSIDSDGQQSHESGSSHQYDDVNDHDGNYVDDFNNDQQPQQLQHSRNERDHLPDEDDNYSDANSYESGHSQQYDDDEDEQQYDPQLHDSDDNRSNDYKGDDKSFDDGNAYNDNDDPQYRHDDELQDDDRPENDGQDSYASSGMSNSEDQQSFIDDNDDQRSKASDMSDEDSPENEYDNEYLSDDGQGSFESHNHDYVDQQPEYDDEIDQDIEEDSTPMTHQPEIPFNRDQQEQYGISEDDNDSQQSGSVDIDPFDDETHPNDIDNANENRIDFNAQNGDEDDKDGEQSYDDENENDEGSYLSEDGSQQFDDEEYEETDGQQYIDNDEDDATFLSAMIGPPPFVEDDTTTEEYAETDNDEDMVKENSRHFLVSDDEDDFADDDIEQSICSNQEGHDGLDQAGWSDRSASTASHSHDRSSSHSTSFDKMNIDSIGDEPNVSSDFHADAPSYHTLRTEKPMENSTHSSIAASKSLAMQNVGVDTDFSGFTSKSSSFNMKDRIAPRVASTHSQKSFGDDKTRSSTTNSHKTDSNQKNDELFIVNTSNRGAQSNMFYSQQRQSSGDFSVDTIPFDMDYDNKMDLENGNDRFNDDPANDAPDIPQQKPIGVVRNNSTDSESFFRVANKYIATENSDNVGSESVRSNRTYLSASNHASAQFENSDQKRYSFVGSDDDSNSLDVDDDGFEYDASNHTPASNDMPSVSTDEKSTSMQKIKNQYDVLREVALEFVSSDKVTTYTSDIESFKSSSSKASTQGESFANASETTSRIIPETKLENISSNATSNYQIYNYSVEESATLPAYDNDIGICFARKDSMESYPAILAGNQSKALNASPIRTAVNTMDVTIPVYDNDVSLCFARKDSMEAYPAILTANQSIALNASPNRSDVDIDEEMQQNEMDLSDEKKIYNNSVDESAALYDNHGDIYFTRKDSIESYPAIMAGNNLLAMNASHNRSTVNAAGVENEEVIQKEATDLSESSSSSSLSSSSKEDTNQYWNDNIRDAEQNMKNIASSGDFENTNHISNKRSQYLNYALSSADDEPTLTHPWIPTSDKKPMTPLLTNTLPVSDEIDASDMKDIETGLYEQEETAPSVNIETRKTVQAKKSRKKRPKWMYGTIGIVFLFIFMLMVVLLTKSKKDSSSPELPPISSPEGVPTTSPVNTPTTLAPPATAAPSSNSAKFVLQATLRGLSGDAFGFGSSVAIHNDQIVVGEPGLGSVMSYYVQAAEWVEGSFVTTDQLHSQFGKSLDLVNGTMVVGAPVATTDINATDGVYVYSHDPIQQTWQQMGTALRGDDDVASSAADGFGSAVAVSNELQVIIGAPQSSRDNENAGRVYTFKYQQSSASWFSNELFALVGEVANDMFGTSVAISNDGTRFIAGAPGTTGPGYVRIYYWIETRWQLSSVLRGTNENENCGSSVIILSDLGEYIVIGCPGFDNGAGRVVVYQQQLSNGRYEQIGPNIVGQPGDGIGYSYGIAGDVKTRGPIILVATKNGSVIRYDYDGTADIWTQLYSPITVPIADQASLAFTSGEVSDTLVIGLSGASNQTLIYSSDSISSSPLQLISVAPTMTPQSFPIATNAPSLSSVYNPINIPESTITPTVPESTETTFAPIPYMITTTAPVNAVTSTPTNAPIPMVAIPSPVAVLSPINTDSLWTIAGGPFTIATDDSTLTSTAPITSIALGGTRMVMGSSSLGTVQSFFQQTITILAVWETRPYQNLYGSSSSITSGVNDEFGAAIDMMDDLLIVGAPGGGIGSGMVYCYRVDATTGDWVSYGAIIQPDPPTSSGTSSTPPSQERFGASVSISVGSTVPRMAIGAPYHSSDDGTLVQRGRVSIYEYDTSIMDWTRNANDIAGTVSDEQLGTAIDLCVSGNFIVIGGPGGGDSRTGTATIYQYSTLDWYAVTTIAGEDSNERFGSSVRMLSEDGFVVAMGGPNYDTNRGRIVVYERNVLTGKYELVGTPIIGDTNEHIGSPNTLSGSSNLSKTIFKVIVPTANGFVKLYEYDKSSSTPTWTFTVIAVVDTTSSSSSLPTVTAATSDASSIVVAMNDDNDYGVATIFNKY